MERTGSGDPTRLLPLLWQPTTRVGRTGLTVHGIVSGAIRIADDRGLSSLTMRDLADRLQVGTMTLYTRIPGRAELLDLMVDKAHAEVGEQYADDIVGNDWRAGVRTVAERNWQMLAQHPWLLDVDTSRPPLGPGTIGKYDAELRSLSGLSVDMVTMDTALALVLEHVRATARQSLARRHDPEDSEQLWWATAGPLLNAYMEDGRYPLAARVGQAAGEAYGSAVDPGRAYAFGLQMIVNGLSVLVDGSQP